MTQSDTAAHSRSHTSLQARPLTFVRSFMSGAKPILVPLFLLLLVAGFTACGPSNPIEDYKKELDKYPEYQVILQDMKEVGNFSIDHMHQYKLVWGEPVGDSLVFNSEITNWMNVPEKVYDQHKGNLGMALIARSDSAATVGTAQPAGYQYVGNPRYGSWQTGAGGSSFWAFYGQYAFMSSMFGMMGGGPIYRNDYNNYRSAAGSGRSYYGKNNRYGTNGSQTKASNKSFFERRTAKARQSAARQRTGRSGMNRFRGRSSGGRGGK